MTDCPVFSVVHTGNREFSCPHCSQRFGRKDHMTRHAKKTHQQFYEPDRQRPPSTPTPSRVEPARNSRKERSVSDPGPFPSSRFSPDGSGIRTLNSPSGVLSEFQKLGTADRLNSSSNISDLLREKDDLLSREDRLEPLYTCPPNSTQNSISVIKKRNEQIYIIPEKSLNAKGCVDPEGALNQSQMHMFDIKPTLEPLFKTYSDPSAPSPGSLEDDKKMEIYSEDSNSTENAMKELLEEKDKIDFDSFINEISEDIFQKKQQLLSPVKIFCDVKDEPRSRPATPEAAPNPLISFPGGDEMDGYGCSPLPDTKPVLPKPVFLRTQSQDSLTRTKNPVLPSIHAEGNLIVPEPKQLRYSSHDPFTLDFEDEGNQLTELKGSLFMSDEDNQAYFQPWN